MNVYVLEIVPDDYDESPYIYSVYSTKEKAINAMHEIAIENNEPMLLLIEDADCYHYPDYEKTCYYIREYEVE